MLPTSEISSSVDSKSSDWELLKTHSDVHANMSSDIHSSTQFLTKPNNQAMSQSNI